MDRGETRRTFLVGGAVGVAGIALGAHAPAVFAAPGREVAEALTVGAPPAAQLRLLGFRRLAAAGHGPAVERLRRTSTRTTRASTRRRWRPTRSRRSTATTVRRATTSARACWPLRLCQEPPLRLPRDGRPTQHSDPRSETQLHAPGWVVATWRAATARCTCRSTRRWRAPSTTHGARASSSACPRTRRADGATRTLGRRVAVLPVPERAAQPDQLLRRAARVRGQHDRRPEPAAPRLPPPARCASCAARSGRPGRGAFPTWGRATTSTATRSSARAQSRTSSRRSTPTSCSTSSTTTSRRGARGWSRSRRATRERCAPWCDAGAARLLDPQRLRELGHRPLPVPLAPVALLGVVLPGAAGDRELEELRHRQRAPLGQVHVRPLARPLRAVHASAGTTTAASPAAACTASPPSSPRASTSSWPASRRWRRRRCCAAWANDPAEEPPPMYAFDPSIGRLAITTPTLQHGDRAGQQRRVPLRGNRHRARWFDSRQRVISHIGGRAPAGFGLLVRAPNGKVVTASQRPRTVVPTGRIPLILNKSPQGPITRVKRYPRSPHAGVFSEIETGGLIDRAGCPVPVALHVQDRPHPRRAGRSPAAAPTRCTAEALLPSWGTATLNVVLLTGATVTLAGTRVGAARRRAVLLHRRRGGRLRRRAADLPAGRDGARAASRRAELEPAARARASRCASRPAPSGATSPCKVAMAPARTVEEAAALAARI